MKNLAILLDKVNNSQKFFSLAQSLNSICNDINAVVFACEIEQANIRTNFPIMEMVHGYVFDGIVISTDFYTTSIMNNIMMATDKYYYQWDIEHIYNQYSFAFLRTVFNNKVIARNEYRYNYLKSTWREPEFIMQEFNHERLERLFSTK